MGNNTSRLYGQGDVACSGSDVPMVPEYLNEILRRMMNEREIYPFSVPDRLSHQNGRGHGKAVCPTCRGSWTSYQVSGDVDMKKQRVMKVWKQKCRNCDTPVHPQFRDYEFEVVVKKLLDRYEAKLRGETPSVWKNDGSGPPHRKDLCEGCDYGKGDCMARADSRSKKRHYTKRNCGDAISGTGFSTARVDSSDSDDTSSDESDFMAQAVSSKSVVRTSPKESSGMSGGEKLAICAGIGLGVSLIGGLLYAAFKPDDDKKGSGGSSYRK